MICIHRRKDTNTQQAEKIFLKFRCACMVLHFVVQIILGSKIQCVCVYMYIGYLCIWKRHNRNHLNKTTQPTNWHITNHNHAKLDQPAAFLSCSNTSPLFPLLQLTNSNSPNSQPLHPPLIQPHHMLQRIPIDHGPQQFILHRDGFYIILILFPRSATQDDKSACCTQCRGRNVPVRS